MTQERISPRQRTLKSGTIAFNRRFSTMDCVVRNLTKEGAMLEFGSTAGIPDHFELKLEHEDYRPCRVAWRREDVLGVEFE